MEFHGDELPGNIRVLSYDELWGRLPFATYVFTDLERLSEKRTHAAHRVWKRLTDAGLRVWNRPGTSMCRYDLQKSLANDFDVYRPGEDVGSVRYPVFLRDEMGHSGNLTPLLHTPAELEEARLRLPGALIVEFLDTADAEGVYRKYSYYRFGDRLFPGHIDFGTSWMVKDSPLGFSVSEWLQEHRDFVANSPHEKEVAEMFRRVFTMVPSGLTIQANKGEYLFDELLADMLIWLSAARTIKLASMTSLMLVGPRFPALWNE